LTTAATVYTTRNENAKTFLSLLVALFQARGLFKENKLERFIIMFFTLEGSIFYDHTNIWKDAITA
jgi:hypothetical protein